MAIIRNGRGIAGHGGSRQPIPGSILARTAPGAQPEDHRGEYAFLVGSATDPATLERAVAEAHRCGASVHQVLLAAGWVSQIDYTAALARALGLRAAAWDAEIGGVEDFQEAGVGEHGLPGRLSGRPYRFLVATDSAPGLIAQRAAALRAQGHEVALLPGFRVDAEKEKQLRAVHAETASRGLLRDHEGSSAGAPIRGWQIIALVTAPGVVAGGFVVVPDATFAALMAVIAFPFLCVTALRLVALAEVATRAPKRMRPGPGRLQDHMLPVYSVLVPLFREANVLADLVQSLAALDYPAAKLEILLALEATDLETQAALLALRLPGNFRTIIVPDQPPRTKPKALNYALQFARGEYVVVYDAEDRPQPDQLRRALEVFRRAPPRLGCVQAQLNIYNPRQSWLTRQFTIEYSALFDAVLPALERLNLPVPLGGTSNHFPRATLLAAGAWDPFNVTEDADLGMRLARLGFHTAVLASTTWEEAPPTFGIWLRQRTRWLKGWMQTYLVHTRRPWRLNAELGLPAAIGFHALMGGLILSALVHPLFYLLLAQHMLAGNLLASADTAAGAVLWGIAWINLSAGYVVSILVGMLSVLRRGRPGLALFALFTPLYWLLISLAAYRALYQLMRDPYLWEKTEHGTGG